MASKKEIFTQMRDKFKDARITHNYSNEDDYDRIDREYQELKKSYLNALSEAMEKTDSYDPYYLKNVPRVNGSGYYMLYHLDKNSSLNECFTALTFLIKNHKNNPGGFATAVNDKTVYRVLKYVCDLL
ncbi:MAG: hypothetical protein IJQ99_02185 [Synergistaceae bacterium]|nr:hypothetical protein [Synergistaceae bacterium]